MRKIVYITFLMGLIMAPVSLLAQSSVKVEGRVTDGETGTPLPGANIAVVRTGFGAVTDENGRYRLNDLPEGEYRLRVSHVGYGTQISGWISVLPDITVSVDFTLKSEIMESPELIVEAGRYLRGAIDPTAGVEIIDKNRIKEGLYRNLGEVLQEVSGVQVQSSGGPGGSQSVSVRGGKPDEVLVMLDGVKISKPHGGAPDLSQIPLSIVDKITVVKGGAGAAAGPETPGGVIYIETKGRPEELPGSVMTQLGSFGAKGISGSWGGSSKRISYFGSYESRSADGDFSYTGPSGERAVRKNAAFSANNAFGKMHYSSTRTVLSLSGFLYGSERGLPGFIHNLSGDARSNDTQVILNAGLTRKLFEKFSLETRHSYNGYWDEDRQISYPSYHTKNRSFSLDNAIRVNSVWSGGFTQTAGVEHRMDQGDLQFATASSRSGIRINRVSSVFLYNEYTLVGAGPLESVTSVLSLGYSFHHRHNGYFTPKAGIAARSGLPLTPVFRINWSRTLHLPDFYDLYFEGYRTLGNPDLRAERGSDFDIGGDLHISRGGQLKISAAFFNNSRTDMIHWRQRFDGVFFPYNLSRVEMKGSEWGLEWRGFSGALTVNGNYTYMKAVNKSGERTTNNKILTNRPVHMLNAGASLRITPVSITVKERYSGKRYIREANSKWLEAYVITDVILGCDFTVHGKKLSTRLGVYNADDRDFMIIERAPMPGREIRLSTELLF